MSTYSALRDLLEARVAAVADVGNVYDYWPLVVRASEIVEYYQAEIAGQDVILWWVVQLLNVRPLPADERTFGQLDYALNFVVHGFRGLRDAVTSETAFIDLSEAVLESVANGDYSGVAGMQLTGGGPPALELDHRVISGILHHHAAIAMPFTATLAGYTGG